MKKRKMSETLSDWDKIIQELRVLQIALVKSANSPEAVRTIARKMGALL